MREGQQIFQLVCSLLDVLDRNYDIRTGIILHKGISIQIKSVNLYECHLHACNK